MSTWTGIPWLTMWHPLQGVPSLSVGLTISPPGSVEMFPAGSMLSQSCSACFVPSIEPGTGGGTQISEVEGSEPSWGTRPTIHQECLGLTCLSGDTVPSLAGVVPSILP